MEWYEIWTDVSDIPYILIMGQFEKSKEIVVIDPKENDKIIFRSESYDDAKFWLLEDEYTMVDGRVIPDT